VTAVIRERRVKLFFFLSALLLIFLAISKVENLLVSLIFAFVTAYMLAPAVDLLERRGFERKWAVILPFIALAVSLSIIVKVFFPTLLEQLQNLQQNYPKYSSAVSVFVTETEAQVTGFMQNIYPLDLKGRIEPQLMSWAGTFFQDLPAYVSKSLMIVFLTPLLAFFMLLDGKGFVRNLLSLVPNNFFELALNLQHQVATQLGGFIRARIIQSILVGLVIWIGLVALDFPYALVLAVVAGVLNVIPYLGPLVGVLPALVISFANGANHGEMAWIAGIYATAQALDAVLITPFVVAKIVDLHPITVILVIIAGSQMMGILGMVICIPVFSALKVSTIAIYKHLTDFRS
jgi:putative permease